VNVDSLAARYAGALFEVAVNTATLDTVSHSIRLLEQVCDSATELLNQLNSPALSCAQRSAVLKKTVKAAVDEQTQRFIDLLNRKGRLWLLPYIPQAFYRAEDEYNNVVQAQVVSARELDKQTQSTIEVKLQQRSGKTVRTNYTVDPSIMGGLRILLGDTLIDASISGSLSRLRLSLAG
jgi:F-type H+-transporting ATPase subunit delta